MLAFFFYEKHHQHQQRSNILGGVRSCSSRGGIARHSYSYYNDDIVIMEEDAKHTSMRITRPTTVEDATKGMDSANQHHSKSDDDDDDEPTINPRRNESAKP